MKKIGRPSLDGEKIIVKLQKWMLEELDEAWRNSGYSCRSEFIRVAIMEKIGQLKVEHDASDKMQKL